MFDEAASAAAAAAAAMNPASAAAALTLVALNTAGIAATPGMPMPTIGHSSVPSSAAGPILQQHQQQQQQQQQQLAQLLTGKDSRWLQLEVCREFQRSQCSRSDQDCKYAHPPAHVEVQNGRVTACYDSIKGRCTRENPKCKYLHPPQHLKDQLLANGKQNLVMKNLISQQLGHQPHPAAGTIPGLAQIVQSAGCAPPPPPHPQHLALQSAAGALQFPYFIPAGLFTAGLLPQADPFAAALQNTAIINGNGAAAPNGSSSSSSSSAGGFHLSASKRHKTENGAATANGTMGGGGHPLQQNGLVSVANTAAGLSAAVAAGMPLYAAAPHQFNPYLPMPTATAQFLPAVSFAGQLPPRF